MRKINERETITALGVPRDKTGRKVAGQHFDGALLRLDILLNLMPGKRSVKERKV